MCIAAMAKNMLVTVEQHRNELQNWSPKFCMVRQLVQYCKEVDEKLVIFSENHFTLDSLEQLLQVVLFLEVTLAHVKRL